MNKREARLAAYSAKCAPTCSGKLQVIDPILYKYVESNMIEEDFDKEIEEACRIALISINVYH